MERYQWEALAETLLMLSRAQTMSGLNYERVRQFVRGERPLSRRIRRSINILSRTVFDK